MWINYIVDMEQKNNYSFLKQCLFKISKNLSAELQKGWTVHFPCKMERRNPIHRKSRHYAYLFQKYAESSNSLFLLNKTFLNNHPAAVLTLILRNAMCMFNCSAKVNMQFSRLLGKTFGTKKLQ